MDKSAYGLWNRPSGGLGILSISGKRLSHSAPTSYIVSTYAVMWKRNGWTLASVMQGYGQGQRQ